MTVEQSGRNNDRPTLSPSQVGLFIGFEQCPRYLKQVLGSTSGNQNELGVFLSEIGDRFEDEKLEDLTDEAAIFIDGDDYDITRDFVEGRKEGEELLEQGLSNSTGIAPALLIEHPIRGQIGSWRISGKSDALIIYALPDRVVVFVLEIKASRDIQPYHRIQSGIYLKLYRDVFNRLLNSRSLEIHAGVVNRETAEFTLTDQSSIPTLTDLDVVEDDVDRLLRSGGTLDSLYETIQAENSEVKYSLTGKCNQCVFNEDCFKHAVKNRNLALLGLSEGEQRVLERHDIETIEEIAELKEVVERPKANVYKELPDRDESTVRALLTEPTIGSRLDQLVQDAQQMMGGLNPDHESGRDTPWMVTYQGAGYGSMPATGGPPSLLKKMDYDPDEMIRVYLYVRQDYLRDTIALLSARVVRKSSTNSPISISEVPENFPDNKDEILVEEGYLLESFFGDLFRSIQRVAGDDAQTNLHLYFFSRSERDSLIDALLRQMPRYSEETFNPVRDILGYREAIDQPMVSIVQDELQQRFPLKYPGSGLLPILEQAANQFCDCGCPGELPHWMTGFNKSMSVVPIASL